MKDYDMSVVYHHDKDNVIVDALSCMTMCSVSHINKAKKDLAREVQKFDRLRVRLESSSDGGCYNSS